MWRSFFMAIAIMLIILGIECLMIDSASVYATRETTAQNFIDPSAPPARRLKVWEPAEWLPWMLLSTGSVVILYAFTLPKRWAGGGGGGGGGE